MAISRHTFLVLVVVVIRYVARLVGHDIALSSMRQNVPYAGGTPLCFCCALDLVRRSSDTVPEVLRELPALVLSLERYLLPGRERGIVKLGRWYQRARWNWSWLDSGVDGEG